MDWQQMWGEMNLVHWEEWKWRSVRRFLFLRAIYITPIWSQPGHGYVLDRGQVQDLEVHGSGFGSDVPRGKPQIFPKKVTDANWDG